MDLQLCLVWQQLVERSIQPVVIDSIRRHTQQLGHCRLRIPLLRDVQFARRIAQPSHHQNQRATPPCDMLLSRRHDPLKELIQLQLANHFQSQPRSAKLPAVLNSNSRRIDFDPLRLDRRIIVNLVEQRQLLLAAAMSRWHATDPCFEPPAPHPADPLRQAYPARRQLAVVARRPCDKIRPAPNTRAACRPFFGSTVE